MSTFSIRTVAADLMAREVTDWRDTVTAELMADGTWSVWALTSEAPLAEGLTRDEAAAQLAA